MAKKIKFALEMADGVQVRTLEELRYNFDQGKAVEYFVNGKLVEWLEDRYYDEEAETISEIEENDPDAAKKICKALGVEYDDDGTDMDNVIDAAAKTAKLKKLTNDEAILRNAAYTAFDQEDLANLLDMGSTTIYLCGKEFSIPLQLTGKIYEGILGRPKIKIKASSQADIDAKKIIFRNVELPWGTVGESSSNSDSKKYNDENEFRNSAIPVDELIELYRDAFLDEDDNPNEIWEYVNEWGYNIDKKFSDSKKKMILRLICKNKFEVNEVAHACINDDMSAGFVFTTSAACLYDKKGFYFTGRDGKCTNIIIPYVNIREFVDESPNNFTLTLKDGNSLSLQESDKISPSADLKDDGEHNGDNGLPLELSLFLGVVSNIDSRRIGCWSLKKGISNYINAVIDLE